MQKEGNPKRSVKRVSFYKMSEHTTFILSFSHVHSYNKQSEQRSESCIHLHATVIGSGYCRQFLFTGA